LNRRNFFKNNIAGTAALGAAAGVGAARAEGATASQASTETEKIEMFINKIVKNVDHPYIMIW